MCDAAPLSPADIDGLSDQLQQQARAYADARQSRGVDDDSFDVAGARAALQKTARPDCVLSPTRAGMMNGVPVIHLGEADGPVLLCLHGGGFVGGSWHTHGHIYDQICRQADLPGLFVDYRLAPEHRFPAAFEDVEGVYNALPVERTLYLAGDSVGGALALHLARLDRQAGTRRIAAIALLAPMLDFDQSTSHYLRNYGRARAMIANAIAPQDLEDFRLRPFDDDLRNLPPTLIQTGGADYVKDDGQRLAAAIAAADGPVAIENWPNMPHVWHRFAPDAPEASSALKRAAAFIRAHQSPIDGV